MNDERERVLQQLETVIEHTHKLQFELLGLHRAMIGATQPDSRVARPTQMPVIPDSAADVDLPDKRMFSVEEAAAILGIGRSTAYQSARTGELPSGRLGHRLLIPRNALVRMLGA